MTPVPHDPSEFEKQKHNLTHIPFQPWCTSCVKRKAQAEPHKRTERIIEDSELPMIQCDYLMLKDVAGTGGLKVLSMYVRTFGYGMSTVVETKGPTDMFATLWAVKMLNFLGLSDIILQCDPEPPLIKWAESVKSKRTERTVIRSFPRRSHQSNGGVENYQKQLQGQVRTMPEAMQEHTQYRPSADNALMRWIVRHAAWLIPRFRGSEIQSPFHRAMGRPYRGKLVVFGETVLAHLPEVWKGSGYPAPKLADRWKYGVWLEKSDLTDEHLVRTDDGVVYPMVPSENVMGLVLLWMHFAVWTTLTPAVPGTPHQKILTLLCPACRAQVKNQQHVSKGNTRAQKLPSKTLLQDCLVMLPRNLTRTRCPPQLEGSGGLWSSVSRTREHETTVREPTTANAD